MMVIDEDFATKVAKKMYETISEEDDWYSLKLRAKKLWIDLAYDVAEMIYDNMELPDEEDIWLDDDLEDIDEF